MMSLQDDFVLVVAEITQGEDLLELGQLHGNKSRPGVAAELLETMDIASLDVDFQVVGNAELLEDVAKVAYADINHLGP